MRKLFLVAVSAYSLIGALGCTAEVRPETPHEARVERREEHREERHEEHEEWKHDHE